MSKFEISTIDLCVILLIIVATGVCVLLLKFLQKNSPHNVQTNGGAGGVKGFLNNIKKKLHFSLVIASLKQGLMVVGGFGGRSDLSSTEVYLPSTKRWTKSAGVLPRHVREEPPLLGGRRPFSFSSS